MLNGHHRGQHGCSSDLRWAILQELATFEHLAAEVICTLSGLALLRRLRDIEDLTGDDDLKSVKEVGRGFKLHVEIESLQDVILQRQQVFSFNL